MAALISVIIPVYRTEAWLEDCVRSVLRQTWPEMEVILSDDGSDDGSPELCRRLCREDGRVKLIAQEHRGVSAARNAAMKAARGEYLFFLDSDDGIHPDLLRTLYVLAGETGAAVAASDFVKIGENSPFPEDAAGGAYRYVEPWKALEEFCSEEQGFQIFGMIGGKLLRRETVNGLTFDETMANSEDSKFMYQLLCQGADTVFCREKWYYYRQRGLGASRKRTAESYFDRCECFRCMAGSELKAGRTANAAQLEIRAVYRMLEAYRVSRRERDSRMREALKDMAGRERKTPRFALLPRHHRIKFRLAFSCYPLYLPAHLISHWLWKRRRGGNKQDG